MSSPSGRPPGPQATLMHAWVADAAIRDGPEETEPGLLERRYVSLNATEAVCAAGARFVTDHPADFPISPAC